MSHPTDAYADRNAWFHLVRWITALLHAINDRLTFPRAHAPAVVADGTLRSDVLPVQLGGAALAAFLPGSRAATANSAAFGHRRLQTVHRVAQEHPVPMYGQICGLFAVDVARFTDGCRDDDIQWHVHKSLYEILRSAFDESGMPWQSCLHEDRGDGALIIVPPGLPAAPLIDPLPERLRALIRRYNRVVREPARIQLRAAAHIGPVHHDGNGFVGSDVNLLFRLLEARSLKRMLAESDGELALVASRYVYENIIVRHPSMVDPTLFQRLNVRVKGTRVNAWAYVPGAKTA